MNRIIGEIPPAKTIPAVAIETAANKIASAELDRAHRMPYEDVGLQGGSPPGTIQASRVQALAGVDYRIDTDVEYVDDPALGQPQTYVNYKRVTVTYSTHDVGGLTAKDFEGAAIADRLAAQP